MSLIKLLKDEQDEYMCLEHYDFIVEECDYGTAHDVDELTATEVRLSKLNRKIIKKLKKELKRRLK